MELLNTTEIQTVSGAACQEGTWKLSVANNFVDIPFLGGFSWMSNEGKSSVEVFCNGTDRGGISPSTNFACKKGYALSIAYYSSDSSQGRWFSTSRNCTEF